MKISQILAILKKQPYFTKQNLSLALGKEAEDLNYWLKKLTKEDLLTPLKNGFYISSYYPDQSEIYWFYLANRLRFPSYVSLETVLARNGLIPESVFSTTSITLKSSRRYLTKPMTFIYQNLKTELFYGYQLIVFGNTGLTAKVAYPYKALFDFLYLKKFNSQKSLKKYLLSDGRINWDAFSNQDKNNFAKIIKTSGSKKMATILAVLKKEKIL